jgi:hypothetical protein
VAMGTWYGVLKKLQYQWLVMHMGGPRGMRTSKAHAGRRTGQVCHRRWNAYGKQQGKGKRSGSRRSCTMSTAPC